MKNNSLKKSGQSRKRIVKTKKTQSQQNRKTKLDMVAERMAAMIKATQPSPPSDASRKAVFTIVIE